MKLKSHSGLKKRIKVTARGKFLFKKPNKNHLLTNKSKKQKKLSPLGVLTSDRDSGQISRMLPYKAR